MTKKDNNKEKNSKNNKVKIKLGEQPIRDASILGVPKQLLLGFQHLFAMFGATVLVPVITGLSVSATLLFAGTGTLLFHFITNRNVPVFLGSSFSFIAGYFEVRDFCPDEENWIPYACFAVACAGVLHMLFAGLIKFFGAKKIMRFFPPVVTGPIIISIGLNLSSSAIKNCSDNWFLAIIAILVVVIANIWGRGMIKIIPIFLGVITSYITAAIIGEIDWTPVIEADWFGIPFRSEDTVTYFLEKFDPSLLITSIITIVPISLATLVEHVGNICAVSETVGKNFVSKPGLHRTLLGDGIATTLSSLFGAPADTTYGENIGVLALSKVYDAKVIRIAAVIAILLSFSPKFAALIHVMPTGTMGGISLVLYGMIASVGIRNIVENKVDFTKQRNVLIAALILVTSIGITYSQEGCLHFTIGGITIGLTGLAVGAILGIVVNAILPGKDFEFSEERHI